VIVDTSSLSEIETISIAIRGLVAGIILVFLSTISFQIFGFSYGLTFIPIFILMYWPRKASRSWSLFFVFLIGTLQSIVGFSPLGLWAFCYLCLFIIMGGEVTFSERLAPAWGSFFICVLFIGTILFFLGRLLLGQWPSLTPLVTDAIASFLVFPLIFWVRKLSSTFGRETERREVS